MFNSVILTELIEQELSDESLILERRDLGLDGAGDKIDLDEAGYKRDLGSCLNVEESLTSSEENEAIRP